MKKQYHPEAIEKKWQDFWRENKTFKSEIDRSKPKYYILDMFPYPSGAGLHVGHVTGYTATDILARYKRQMGFNVLHPMGWDSFGLPAEQYAIRTGTHPAVTTEKNINTYRCQLQSLGFSYDWDREFATSDSKYYKWTQWIFTKLFEKNLAYEAEVSVNYCEALGTVLSNEEVENGRSVEGGFPVEKRPLKQWILKITDYAERLLSDLNNLDWPDYLKRLQRNWIGRSEGADIAFKEVKTQEPITIYTTRPDTMFGATFLVLSPEHPLVSKLTTDDQRASVEAYQKASAQKSDLERTDLAKDKSGVWTGTYVINPFNGRKIPLWVADYVLMGYGTGAVIGVPGGDERDFEFAKKYELPIIATYDPDLEAHPDEIPDGMAKEDFRIEVLAGRQHWKLEGKCINSENEDLNLNGMSIQEAISKAIDWVEKKEIGKRAINYKLRDWLFSRQRYWGEPFPILHFEDGTKRVLELDELPLCPPELQDYKPAGDGKSPLSKVKEWVEITDPKTGKKALRETNTMPQWAGSCWYYLRFCDPHNEEIAWDPEKESYWMPIDLYVGGVEHAVLHLLYARFWHKVLFDLGYVSTKEPFQTLRNQGLVTAKAYKKSSGGYVHSEDVTIQDSTPVEEKTGEKLTELVEKMSKSKLNGVPPDEMIAEFGADALRLYEMFMAPFDKEKLWNTDAVSGCKRFLNRFFDMIYSEKITDEETDDAMHLAHKLVKGVQEDIENMQFNTAVAKMMEFLNGFMPLASYPKKALKMAVQCLYPFAPHVTEEFWQHLGGEGQTISYQPFPKWEEKYIVEESAIYVLQINGKMRGRWELPRDQTRDQVFEIVKKDERVQSYLEGEILKMIFVPNKLLNIVVKK